MFVILERFKNIKHLNYSMEDDDIIKLEKVWDIEAGAKKWHHIAIRPSTYHIFKKLNKEKSANAFVVELLMIYKKRLAFLEKKKAEKQNV